MATCGEQFVMQDEHGWCVVDTLQPGWNYDDGDEMGWWAARTWFETEADARQFMTEHESGR